MSESTKTPVIVCGGDNGRCVIYGYAATEPEVGQPVTLTGARMILRWRGRPGGLLEVADLGPGAGSSLSPVVARTGLVCQQWVSVSAAGAEALDSWI